MTSKIQTAFSIFFSYIIRAFSYLFPRNKNIWIFIGWHKNNEREIFADNSKYLFLYASRMKNDIRAIWIAQDRALANILTNKGYESYSINSIAGLYYSLRAGYTFISAFLPLTHWRLSSGSRIVQLWHGGSIKGKVGLWRLQGVPLVRRIIERLSLPGAFQRFHFFATYSEYSALTFPKKNFNIPTERTLITGVPRHDVFFRDIPDAEIDMHAPLGAKLAEIHAGNPKKIVLYAPTFRRGEASKSPFSKLDFNKLQDFAVRMNYFFVISLHPKYASTEWAVEGMFPNIFFCSPSYDKLPLLRQFDMLITDYSSCFIDFLLLNKPTIFFAYDLEEYRKDPGIDEEFWRLIPGPRVKTMSALLHTLEQPDEFVEERERARDTFFAYKDGAASERIAHAILKDMHNRDSR